SRLPECQSRGPRRQSPRRAQVVKLQGLVAVITGAGSGIGRASALAFGEQGACVLAADLNAASVDETAEQVRAAGGNADTAQVDVTNADQVEAMVRRAVERFGR